MANHNSPLDTSFWMPQPTKASEMTLRDYFAGLAMAAIIGKFPPGTSPDCGTEKDLRHARGAYRYADALLRVRAGEDD